MQTNEIPHNESPHICRSCGGECCRTRPGIESPRRFMAAPGGPAVALHEALASGLWVLERHYGLPPGSSGEPQVPAAELTILYPRPVTVLERTDASIFAGTEIAPCTHLADNGCVLPFDERPLMCRALEPDGNFNCESTWTRVDAARAWYSWQDLVASVITHFPETGTP